MADDLYAVLGVGKSSTQAEVKRAYRELARKYHPDKNPGDNEAERIFKDAAEAYRILGDADLRAQYDRYGRAGGGRAPPPQQQQGGGEEDGPGGDAPGDVFGEIFGGRPKGQKRGAAPDPTARYARRPPAERGEDLKYTLELDFEDAAFGCERPINIPRKSRCQSCGGTGARAGTAPIICQACGGVGVVRAQQGFFSVNDTCDQCGGTGKLIPEGCPECRGKGEVRAQHTIPVQVPPGVDSGTRLKITGEGEAGAGGGPRGDLFVVIQVKPHPFFKREEDDVTTDVPITFPQAALGSTIEIPTLDGKVRMRVAAGSQSGRVFRLKGKGIPSMDGRGRGDQRVRVIVEIPQYLSPEQRELLDRYADLDEEHNENPVVRDFLSLMDEYYRGG